MKSPVYLDYAATTPLDSAVFDAMKPYLGQLSVKSKESTVAFGNPGSLHSFGQQASAALFTARQMIAKELGCRYNEVVFTGSATEANNLALRGAIKQWRFLQSAASTVQPRIIISAIEHESILATAKDLGQEGVEVVVIPVSKEGSVDLQKIAAALTSQTVLVSVMYANNEIGTLQPIAEIARSIQSFRRSTSVYPLLHTDAVQAFQYVSCNVEKLGVDLLTLSAHKIYGPKGIGALYVRAASTPNLKPTITGGGQEFGLRSGTENVAAIVGFSKAVSLAAMNREDEAMRVATLRNQAWAGIKKLFPKVVLNGPATTSSTRLPNNLNWYAHGVSGEQLLVALDLDGVAVSSGSACAARSTAPSHVIQALGCSLAQAKNSLRVSLGAPTTSADIRRFLAALQRAKKQA